MHKADIKYILRNWKRTIPAIIANKFRDNRDRVSLYNYYPNYNEDLNSCLEAKKPKSDTVYILGSGSSINNITKAEWNEMSNHDTITFNWFAYQDFVNIDYYLIKDISFCDRDKNNYLKEYHRFSRLLENNWQRYEDCLFILQKGPLATNTSKLLYHRSIPKDAAISNFKMYRGVNLTLNFPWLSVKVGTLLTAIHFALLMKWKKIIIAGVDLYDRDYFWYKEGEIRDADVRRGAKVSDKHATVENGLMKILEEHVLPVIKEKEVEMYIQNPKSLLAEILPVFQMEKETV